VSRGTISAGIPEIAATGKSSAAAESAKVRVPDGDVRGRFRAVDEQLGYGERLLLGIGFRVAPAGRTAGQRECEGDGDGPRDVDKHSHASFDVGSIGIVQSLSRLREPRSFA
jgi:hypothetical protein